jgi:hypothetical protein
MLQAELGSQGLVNMPLLIARGECSYILPPLAGEVCELSMSCRSIRQ